MIVIKWSENFNIYQKISNKGKSSIEKLSNFPRHRDIIFTVYYIYNVQNQINK